MQINECTDRHKAHLQSLREEQGEASGTQGPSLEKLPEVQSLLFGKTLQCQVSFR